MRRVGRSGRKRHKRCNDGKIDPWNCSNVKIIELMKWLTRAGLNKRACHVAAKYFKETGRGLVACKSFKPGDLVLSVPYQLLLTTSTVLHSDLGPIIASFPGKKLSAIDALCCFLIFERKRGTLSSWFHYIDSLPHSYTIPAYWTQSEIDYLPLAVRQKAEEQIALISASYTVLSKFFDYCCATLAGWNRDEVFSYDSYQWAWSTVNTRCVYLSRSRSEPELGRCEDDQCCLIPLLDLFNHSAYTQVDAGYNEETMCYNIRTLSGCRRFGQVFINYGPHSNARLIVDYGFILDHNPHDSVLFTVDDMIQAAKHLVVERELRKKLDILTSKGLISGLVCSADGLSWNLTSALLVLSLDVKQLSTVVDVVFRRCIPHDLNQSMLRLAIRLLQNALLTIPNPEVLQSISVVTYNATIARKLADIQRNILLSTLKDAQEQLSNGTMNKLSQQN